MTPLMKLTLTLRGHKKIPDKTHNLNNTGIWYGKYLLKLNSTLLQAAVLSSSRRAHAKPKQTKVLTPNPIRNNTKKPEKMGTAHSAS